MSEADTDRLDYRLALTLSKEDYGEALRALVEAARQKPGSRTQLLQSFGKFAIYALFGFPVLFLLLYYFHWDVRVAGSLSAIIFGLYYIAVSLHFRWTDSWLGFSYDPERHGQGIATFSTREARLTGPAHEQVWNWSLLRKLHSTPRLHVVEFAGYEIVVVPRSAFTTQDEEQGWSEFVRSRLPPEP